LERAYGKARWRKLKGNAKVQLENVGCVWRKFIGTKLMALANAR